MADSISTSDAIVDTYLSLPSIQSPLFEEGGWQLNGNLFVLNAISGNTQPVDNLTINTDLDTGTNYYVEKVTNFELYSNGYYKFDILNMGTSTTRAVTGTCNMPNLASISTIGDLFDLAEASGRLDNKVLLIDEVNAGDMPSIS